MSQRKRAKVGRYDPKLMQELRAEIAKHPNPMFGRMLAEGRMSDGDVLDFSLNVAKAYFNGALLEPVTKAAGRELGRLMRRTLLVTAALFGMTGKFAEDGSVTITSAWTDDPATQTAAIQALVDTGISVGEAMASFKICPPETGLPPGPMHTRLPEIEVVH